LRIGDSAPPLALPDLDGKEQYLFDILGQSPVLLVFAPGSWSPNTREQVRELLETHDAFVESGVTIVMVVTEDPRTAQRLIPKDGPVFPVLIDEDREAARDYGVYRAFSLDGLRVTRPASFLIDQDGVLRFVYVGHGDRDIPDVPGLLRLCSWLLPQPSVPEPVSAAGEMAATEEEEGLDALATMAVQLVEAEAGEPTEVSALPDTLAIDVVADSAGEGVDVEPALFRSIGEEGDKTQGEADKPNASEEAPDGVSSPGEEASLDGLAESLAAESLAAENLAKEAARPSSADDGEAVTRTTSSTPDSNGEVHDPSDVPDGKETALSGQGTG
jgi:peroxiredoxin